MSSVETSWSFFEMQFSGHPHLALDPLYALPKILIAALEEEGGAGLTSAEWEFEHALADWSAHGFFRKQPFVHPLLEAGSVPRLARPMAKHQQETGTQLNELLDSEMRGRGISDGAIRFRNEMAEEIQLRSRDTARGYLGWLVTDARFRQEFKKFSSIWDDRVWSDGCFPVLPVSVCWSMIAPSPVDESGFVAAARLFLQRWSLETIVTLDLPLPLLPQLTTSQAYDPEWIGDSGVSVYVPNYLFRQKTLSLAPTAQLEQSFGHLGHLDGWLHDRTKDWGGRRFGYILDVYVYLELALKARYGDRLNGHSGCINRAFGQFWKRSPDTVAVARGELTRRLELLKSAEDADSPGE